MISLIIYIEQAFRNFGYRFKGNCFKVYLMVHGCQVGRGFKCISFPKLRAIPNKNIRIGNNVTLGRNMTFEISHEGKLFIGNNVLLGDNILLSTTSEIRLCDWSGIAENVSVRGSFHEMGKDSNYQLQGTISGPIIMEEDAGIGAGCVILVGATIPKGSFIGSNSLVLKNTKLEPYGIYGGNPLKLIKLRE